MRQLSTVLSLSNRRGNKGMKAKDSFDMRVWKTVLLIPYGYLATYGQIANLLEAYGCSSQVGWNLRRLSLPSNIP